MPEAIEEQEKTDNVDFKALRDLLCSNKFKNNDIGPINALDEIDIFIISPPKCGTTALQRGFERLGRKVLHAHNDITTYAAFGNGQLLADAGIGLGTMLRYRRSVGRGPIHIFCGYREPISWYLSMAGHFGLPLNNELKERITHNIADQHPWNLYPFADTRSAIEDGVGFDILTEPFNFERGYTVLRHNDVNVILYRHDHIADLTNYIKSEIDSNFTLNDERVNSNESYMGYVQKFRLDRNTCQLLYDNPVSSYFLSPQDQLRLIEKHSRSGTVEADIPTKSPVITCSIAPDELTNILYANLLGRQPEPAAMAGMPRWIQQTGDVGMALRNILASDEFKLKHPRAALAAQAYQQLGRRPRIVDVGAQTLGPGSHIYNGLMQYCEVEITGFDPLQDRLAERQDNEGGPHLTLIPHALGDGGIHTLHINNHDATSSLYPLNEEGNTPFPLLAQLKTVRTETVETRRLDDVIPHQQIDFLKLDVQGGELLILEHGKEVLKQTAIIHCEVEFSPIYKNQPLFADINEFLAQQGFYFLDFSFLGRYAPQNSPGFNTNDRLMWADAIFVHPDASNDMRAAQALVLTLIYQKYALAEHLLKA